MERQAAGTHSREEPRRLPTQLPRSSRSDSRIVAGSSERKGKDGKLLAIHFRLLGRSKPLFYDATSYILSRRVVCSFASRPTQSHKRLRIRRRHARHKERRHVPPLRRVSSRK